MNFFKKIGLKHSILPNKLESKVEVIKASFNYSEDMIIRKLNSTDLNGYILYLESMIDEQQLANLVLKPLTESKQNDIEKTLLTSDYEKSEKTDEITSSILEGKCAILLENKNDIFLANIPNTEDRTIEEPENERTIQGSHVGFTENIKNNIFLIRSRIKNTSLFVKDLEFGSRTNTKVSMMYIENLVNKDCLSELESKLSSMDIKNLQSEMKIEELIEDNGFTIFPQILSTERPDRASSYLLEGKIVILVEGSPQVLILPINFFSFFQSPDDDNERWIVGSFFRIIRLVSFLISISLPALYIAIISFHPEVLPLGILYAIRVQVEYIPLTPFFEAVTMQTVLELLKEAAIRLPSPIGQTIGVVGGLVIGTAIVEAGFVSSTMIIVIALTAIASFVTPVMQMGTSARLLGFPIMVASNLFGFFGIVLSLSVVVMHLCKLQSFGMPYFKPIAPLSLRGLKDYLVKGSSSMKQPKNE